MSDQTQHKPVLQPLTDAWFDVQFQNSDGTVDVPAQLQDLSKAFCQTFDIRGLADPRYVANVAAFEFDLGNGQGSYHAGPNPSGDDFQRLAKRLAGSYASSVTNAHDVRQVIVAGFYDLPIEVAARKRSEPLSPEWFAAHLEDPTYGIPVALQRISKAFLLAFRTDFLHHSDPRYIANVAARELGLGDGQGTFHDGPLPRGHQFNALVEHLLDNHVTKQVVVTSEEVRRTIVAAFLDRTTERGLSDSPSMAR